MAWLKLLIKGLFKIHHLQLIECKMTKEELYKAMPNANLEFRISELDEFFSQNVVIPKGQNRHPYADIWHKFIEGDTKCDWRYPDDDWEDWVMPNFTEYRIKPQELVYEWRYEAEIMGEKVTTNRFLTEEEAEKFYSHFEKIESTKRVRQWLKLTIQ